MSETLTPGELARLAHARHQFWCQSTHHQTAFCLDSMRTGADAQGIDRERAVIEEILSERVSRALKDAADDPALRLSGHSGISISRLRQRAEATR